MPTGTFLLAFRRPHDVLYESEHDDIRNENANIPRKPRMLFVIHTRLYVSNFISFIYSRCPVQVDKETYGRRLRWMSERYVTEPPLPLHVSTRCVGATWSCR